LAVLYNNGDGVVAKDEELFKVIAPFPTENTFPFCFSPAIPLLSFLHTSKQYKEKTNDLVARYGGLKGRKTS